MDKKDKLEPGNICIRYKSLKTGQALGRLSEEEVRELYMIEVCHILQPWRDCPVGCRPMLIP